MTDADLRDRAVEQLRLTTRGLKGWQRDHLPATIASKVGDPDENGCWPWVASLRSNGYGQVRFDGTIRKAHRIVYQLLVGPIPDGLQIDHLCRIRHCVNPAHLEVVTQRENLLRGDTITARNASRTHCPSGHPYSEENTYRRTSGRRDCRDCKRIRDRKRVAK